MAPVRAPVAGTAAVESVVLTEVSEARDETSTATPPAPATLMVSSKTAAEVVVRVSRLVPEIFRVLAAAAATVTVAAASAMTLTVVAFATVRVPKVWAPVTFRVAVVAVASVSPP